jgi:predicted DNA-binding protein with PD1-like motif
MLELVNITGNIVSDKKGERYHHTHGLFSYRNEEGHQMTAGHMKSSTVLYTVEIELRPVIGGRIGRTYDPETGTGFWDLRVD